MPLQGESGLTAHRQQADFTLCLGLDLAQAGETGVGHLQRCAIGADLERLAGRQLEVTGTARIVTAAPQVHGEVTGMTTDPHRETFFDQLNHAAMHVDPHVTRTGKIGCLMQKLVGELKFSRAHITIGRLDDLESTHFFQRPAQPFRLPTTALGQKVEAEVATQHRRDVRHFAIAIQLIDATGQQAKQAVRQFV